MADTLSETRILDAAVELADASGLESMSMRRLAEILGVTPMALYKHVANREALIDGMVDTIVAQIGVAPNESDAPNDWMEAVRSRLLSARQALARHSWAVEAIQTRQSSSPTVLAYMDSLMGLMRSGGLSPDLVHHAMHALSTRMWGLTRDVFPTPPLPEDPAERAEQMNQTVADYPHIGELVTAVQATGSGCDAEVEFAFAIDILLDGFNRLHEAGWEPS